MNQRLLLVTAITPALWGTTYAVTTELLPPGRPLLAAALRALPAGLLLLALTRRLPTGQWWWRSAVLGTLNIGAFFALLFVSAYRLPGGIAAVLGAVQPLLVAGLAFLLLAQRVTRRTLLSGLAGLIGVSLTVLTAEARLDAVGVLAGVAGTASMGLGIVLTKRWGTPAPALTVAAWQLTAGGLLLLPTALAVEGLPGALAVSHLAGYSYLSVIGTAVAYGLWFRGLERLPATSISFLVLLSPVVATVLGWALLGQSLHPLQLLGMAVALTGVVTAQRPPRDVRLLPQGATGRVIEGAASGEDAMSAARSWTVQVLIEEDGDRTHADAVLHTGDTSSLRGRGDARRDPHDPSVAEIGDELATARALADLAQKLLQTTASDIDAVTGGAVSLAR